MGFEVEIKYRLEDAETLARRLRAEGALERPEVGHRDLYLAHPARDFAATDEALRLRAEGESNHVTYKGPKRGGPTKTREELEVPFEPGPEASSRMALVFEHLGFLPVAEVAKFRRAFSLEHEGRALTVTIDRADGLGTFAEVEALAANAEDLSAAQEAVIDLAARLGLWEVEPRSYLRMTLESGGQGTGG